MFEVLNSALCLAATLVTPPAPPETFKLTPARIEMGAFYDGAQLRIEGVAEPGSKVAVVLRGAGITETFNRRGRVGPVWVNTGKAHISGVPSLFLAFTPEPVDALLRVEETEKYQLEEAAIRRQMRVDPKEMDQEVVRAHYWKMKTEQGVYRIVDNGVRMGAPAANGTPYSGEFLWPKKAPPGSYEVRVYECRDGRVIRQSSAALEVVRVGFPAMMAALARDRTSLYGVVAVIAAMIAGFGIDFLAAHLPGGKAKARRVARSEPARGEPRDLAAYPSTATPAGERHSPG